MTKTKTKVINETGAVVFLKLSTGGVISILSNDPLQNKEHYYISIDLTTTYREYWCAVQPNQEPSANPDNVILNSDDCTQFSEVTLICDPNGSGVTRYTWVGTKPRDLKDKRTGLQGSSSGGSSSTSVHKSSSGSQVTTSASTPLNADRATTRSGSSSRSDSRCTIL